MAAPCAFHCSQIQRRTDADWILLQEKTTAIKKKKRKRQTDSKKKKKKGIHLITRTCPKNTPMLQNATKPYSHSFHTQLEYS